MSHVTEKVCRPNLFKYQKCYYSNMRILLTFLLHKPLSSGLQRSFLAWHTKMNPQLVNGESEESKGVKGHRNAESGTVLRRK